MGYTPTFKRKYQEEIVPALQKEFSYKSVMQVPVLEKIIINQVLVLQLPIRKS